MKSFSAKIHKIGINPYIGVPGDSPLFELHENGKFARKKYRESIQHLLGKKPKSLHDLLEARA